jgi:hypothetical protein
MNKKCWSELEDEACPCKGSGWAQIEGETWENCFIHFNGQLHPESKSLLLNEPKKLQEEERRALLRYKIQKSRERINILQSQLKTEQKMLGVHELELINKTPTVRMKAVDVTAPLIDIDWEDIAPEA